MGLTHIRRDGRIETEAELAAREAGGIATGPRARNDPQATLFDDGGGDDSGGGDSGGGGGDGGRRGPAVEISRPGSTDEAAAEPSSRLNAWARAGGITSRAPRPACQTTESRSAWAAGRRRAQDPVMCSYMAAFAPAASPAQIASRIRRCSSMVSSIRAAVADPW